MRSAVITIDDIKKLKELLDAPSDLTKNNRVVYAAMENLPLFNDKPKLMSAIKSLKTCNNNYLNR